MDGLTFFYLESETMMLISAKFVYACVGRCHIFRENIMYFITIHMSSNMEGTKFMPRIYPNLGYTSITWGAVEFVN